MRATLLLVLTFSACGSGGSSGRHDAGGDDMLDAKQTIVDSAPLPIAGAHLYDPARLHKVEITIATEDLATLDSRANQQRVPCVIRYDEMMVANAGIRLKGLGSFQTLSGKPSFSIKVNEFDSKARLDGVRKLLLNNQAQDPSMLNEHIGYATHRAAGLASPLAAYAWVSLNGKSYGLYVVREPISKDFLIRNFGSADTDGNLYEGYWHPDQPNDLTLGDFAEHPEELILDDEVAEQRTRADVVALAAAVKAPDSETWATNVAAHIELADFHTKFALDGLLGSQDSLPYFSNNYYLYHRVGGKFVYLPSGMDRLRLERIDWNPTSLLSTRILAHAVLGPEQAAERARLRSTLPWTQIIGAVDVLDAALHNHSFVDPRLTSDIERFDANKADRKARLARYLQ